MLAVAEAQRRVYAGAKPTPAEWVALPSAYGRVLSQDLVAARDQPPCAVSAMDGYAVRAADMTDPDAVFRVVGTAPAGHAWAGTIGPREVVRIFTGGTLPPGADAIAIQENANRIGEDRVRFARASSGGEFVRPAGLDFTRGWPGLRVGTALDPRALGLAAIMGHGWLPVRRRPRVGILATGDEIRWPGATPDPGEIISSNSTTLAAMVSAWGGEPVDLGIAADRPEALIEALRHAHGLDLLVTSGGASVGDYDLVQSALGAEGLELDFWRIAMRPGKPLLFGRLGDVQVLGLPGNPVSAGVCAIVFLRGAVRTALGLPTELPLGEARLEHDLPANDEREDYLRTRLTRRYGDLWALPAKRQDSSMFATFVAADGLIVRPPRDDARKAGDRLKIIDLAAALRSLP